MAGSIDPGTEARGDDFAPSSGAGPSLVVAVAGEGAVGAGVG